MNRDSIGICSFNTNGLGSKTKRQAVSKWLKSTQSGIIFLQETHSNYELETIWKRDFESNNLFFSHGSSSARGVCILIPNNSTFEIKNTITDNNGRFLLIHLVLNDTEMVLVNIYAPTKDHKQEQLTFLSYVQNTLIDFLGKTIILGGDFNTYLNPVLDKSGGLKEAMSETAKVLLNICDEFGLIDVYRSQNPDGKRYTWRNKGRAGLVQSRLDMFFVSEQTQFLNIKFNTVPGLLSDHSLIQINFDTDRQWTRGRGFWKFNVELLKDTEYINLIYAQIDELKNMEHTLKNKSLLWDYIKCKLRGITISYASYKAKERKRTEKELQKKLQQLDLSLCTTPSHDSLTAFSQIKQDLEQIYLAKIKGSAIRSRAELIENNERNTKYFLNLEKKNFNSRCIKCLRVGDKVIQNEEDILNEEKNFFKNLYSENNIDDDQTYELENKFLQNDSIPKLSDDDKQLCDIPITLKECADALSELKNNKSPGCDGFPVEFHKFFWSKIQYFVHNSFTWSAENGILSADQKKRCYNPCS